MRNTLISWAIVEHNLAVLIISHAFKVPALSHHPPAVSQRRLRGDLAAALHAHIAQDPDDRAD